MKIEINKKVEIEAAILAIKAEVRYWENSIVNGEYDTEDGDNVPCKVGNDWMPIIDIDGGKILNWRLDTTAKIHYKVCDQCGWKILDKSGDVILELEEGYVPDTLCPSDNGYGDYIIMDIDEDGFISDWEFDIDDFIDTDA